MAIDTLEELRCHLQLAIEIEHTTIPAYLCAAYTIKPDANREAYLLIRSVAVQEMLHLTIAANLLNAVGGEPAIDRPAFVPEYPKRLPFTDIVVSLAPFSQATIEACAVIEHPGPEHRVVEEFRGEKYGSIAEFYDAIKHGLVVLCQRLGPEQVFAGDPARQVGIESFYGAAGGVPRITGLGEAGLAIDTIIDQGEGLRDDVFDGDHLIGETEEVAHYFRFLEVLAGRYYRAGDTPATGPTGPALSVDWNAAYPMCANPKIADYPPGSEVRARAEEFNAVYRRVLAALHLAFNGEPALLRGAVIAMDELRDRATALVRNPFPGRPGVHAGPTFEFGTAP
jgi:hypothetical protein